MGNALIAATEAWHYEDIGAPTDSAAPPSAAWTCRRRWAAPVLETSLLPSGRRLSRTQEGAAGDAVAALDEADAVADDLVEAVARPRPTDPYTTKEHHVITTISIIGSGNMATAIGTRAAKHGHTIELMSRNTAKAQALADQIGNGATVGTFGAQPAGDIVIVAVLYTGAVEVVAHYGDALAGKILVDITNPFNADVSGLVTTAGNSVSEQIAAAPPEGAHVVKAFNSILCGVLGQDKPVDVFFAGDAGAKARVAAFLESLDMRPLDAGGLEMAWVLEWAASSW